MVTELIYCIKQEKLSAIAVRYSPSDKRNKARTSTGSEGITRNGNCATGDSVHSTRAKTYYKDDRRTMGLTERSNTEAPSKLCERGPGCEIRLF